jgi:hypothetical protein
MALFSLPDQTIPEHLKTEEWHINHVKDYVTHSINTGNDHRAEMLRLYKSYQAEHSPDDPRVKRITCPHGSDLGIPYTVYPLVQSKIEQIAGEYMLRPVRRKAYVLDKKSKNKKMQKMLDVMSEEIMRGLSQKLQPELGFTPETEQPEIDLPEDVEEFFEKDFKMIQEEVADNLLAFLLDVRKEGAKLKELFNDYAIVDRCHAVIDKKHKHTTIRKVHPMDADYDLDPYKVVQDNHEYFFENYWLTENEIYNSFTLTQAQKAKIRETFLAFEKGDSSSDELSGHLDHKGWHKNDNNTHRLRLVSAMWKSRKRTSIKVSEGKDGKTFYKKLKDEKEARAKDKVEHIDGEMPRYVQMLGPDICLAFGEMPVRLSSKENPYETELPVVSIVRDNTTGTSKIKSVAAKLDQLQDMASEILFEIRLALKSAGNSRVLVYDAAQTPKEFSKGAPSASGLNRVFHHVKKDNMLIINSKEKGATKNTFNQFTSLDLSQKGAIQDLFNGLAIIEDLASKFVGISPEREGQVGQYQTASGTDKAIRGSAARTEVIFTPFDDFVQALLLKILNKAKHDYEEGEVIQYVFGEMKTKFIKLFKEFFDCDLGLYLSDGRKDKEASERINAAAEMALGTANTPEMIMGLIEVFEGDHAVEKKATFQRLLNSMEKLQAEQAKAAQEAEAAKLKTEEAKAAQELLISRENNETEIEVANIYVKGKGMADSSKANSAEKIEAARLYQKQQAEELKNQKPAQEAE